MAGTCSLLLASLRPERELGGDRDHLAGPPCGSEGMRVRECALTYVSASVCDCTCIGIPNDKDKKEQTHAEGHLLGGVLGHSDSRTDHTAAACRWERPELANTLTKAS